LPFEITRGDLLVSDDRDRLQLDVIHGFLAGSYWAEGIPIDVVSRSIDHSLAVGAYLASEQVGFARVITDYATFGYLADVFVLEEARGRGIARVMLELLFAHPSVQTLRRWMLVTRDAHSLYRELGFESLANPERLMEIVRRGMYLA
jgi:GNAT superfamily N-acetyltransferase